jgi:hypothetical protein
MTGTTLFTASRILSRWTHEGLIEAGREKVLLRRPHQLVCIAEDLPSAKAASKSHEGTQRYSGGIGCA